MSAIRNKQPNLELNNYNRRGVEAHAGPVRDAKLMTQKQYDAMTDGYVGPRDLAVAKRAIRKADTELFVKGPNPKLEAARNEAQTLVREVKLAIDLQGWVVTGREALRDLNVVSGFSKEPEESEPTELWRTAIGSPPW